MIIIYRHELRSPWRTSGWIVPEANGASESVQALLLGLSKESIQEKTDRAKKMAGVLLFRKEIAFRRVYEWIVEVSSRNG